MNALSRRLLPPALHGLLGRPQTQKLAGRYIKATVGFEQLGAETGSSPKGLIRMFGPADNPQASNLFAVISLLQRHARLTLHVQVHPQLRTTTPR